MASPGPQCAATTLKGTRCKNRARAGSAYCGVHKNYKGGHHAEKAAAAPKLAKLAGRTSTTPTGTMDALNAATTRDQAAATLNRLTVPQLRAFAEDNSLAPAGRTKKDLVAGIVDQTVGARLNRASIQHEENDAGIDRAAFGAQRVSPDSPGAPPRLATMARAPRAPRGGTAPAGDPMERLQAATTRDQAADVLNGLTVTQLRSFARDNNLTPVGSNKRAIVQSLIDQTVGKNISSHAMQAKERGFAGVPGGSRHGGGGSIPARTTGPAAANRGPAIPTDHTAQNRLMASHLPAAGAVSWRQGWGRLSTVKPALRAQGWTDTQIDATLLRLLRERKIMLVPDEDQKSLTPADRREGIVVGDKPSHLIALTL